MDAQPLLDQTLHQYEDADRDEEARAGTEIEQERAACDRANCLSCQGAQQQRHAPGDPDQKGGAPAGTQCPLVQQPHALLKLIERSAARDQKLADRVHPTPGGVGPHSALALRRYAHGHAPRDSRAAR
jgi:hypothetical protein